MDGEVVAEQPHRDGLGRLDGGYMYGVGEACRAADVLIEDKVSPPLYTGRPTRMMRVESTHFDTRVIGEVDDGTEFGMEAIFALLSHPYGIARP